MQSISNAAQAELTAALRSTADNKESNDLIIAGNLLQSLGNALQVIAGFMDEESGNGNGRGNSKSSGNAGRIHNKRTSRTRRR